jgi:hypothetical protein
MSVRDRVQAQRREDIPVFGYPELGAGCGAHG